jgi:CysZ protein
MLFKKKFDSFKENMKHFEVIILDTLQVFFDAHRFIRKHNYRTYLLVSGLAFLVLFSLTIKGLTIGLDKLQEPVSQKLTPYLQEIINLSIEDIRQGITATFWLLKKAIESNKDAIFGGIFLIIGTPYFSFLSSKTEELATGKSYPFKWKTFWKEIRRGLSLSLRNSLKQAGLILIITLIGFIPVINTITPILTFIIQAYYNGILMTDYTLERQGFTVSESLSIYKSNKPEMFAIGLGFMFLLLIPVLGWFMAPVYGIVASYLQFSKIKYSKDSSLAKAN